MSDDVAAPQGQPQITQIAQITYPTWARRLEGIAWALTTVVGAMIAWAAAQPQLSLLVRLVVAWLFFVLVGVLCPLMAHGMKKGERLTRVGTGIAILLFLAGGFLTGPGASVSDLAYDVGDVFIEIGLAALVIGLVAVWALAAPSRRMTAGFAVAGTAFGMMAMFALAIANGEGPDDAVPFWFWVPSLVSTALCARATQVVPSSRKKTSGIAVDWQKSVWSTVLFDVSVVGSFVLLMMVLEPGLNHIGIGTFGLLFGAPASAAAAFTLGRWLATTKVSAPRLGTQFVACVCLAFVAAYFLYGARHASALYTLICVAGTALLVAASSWSLAPGRWDLLVGSVATAILATFTPLIGGIGAPTPEFARELFALAVSYVVGTLAVGMLHRRATTIPSIGGLA